MRDEHGHTPAGWISVAVLLVGAVIAGFGVGLGLLWLGIVGGSVMLAGIVTALALQAAGLGQYPPRRSHSYDSAQAYLGAQRAEDPLTRRRDVPGGS